MLGEGEVISVTLCHVSKSEIGWAPSYPGCNVKKRWHWLGARLLPQLPTVRKVLSPVPCSPALAQKVKNNEFLQMSCRTFWSGSPRLGPLANLVVVKYQECPYKLSECVYEMWSGNLPFPPCREVSLDKI